MRILVVDDDRAILEDISEALVPGGYEVVAEENPLVALEKLDEGEFDVVITDIRMPEMNGIELLKRVREKKAALPVIVMTAYGDVETAIACVNNHAYGFLAKPLDFSDLLAMIQQIEKEKQGAFTVDYQKLKEAYQDLKSAYDQLYEMMKHIEKQG
jgi:DNA-binding NtrC family response regulator